MEFVTFDVPGEPTEGGGTIHLNPSQIGSIQANHKSPAKLTTIMYQGVRIKVQGSVEEVSKALGWTSPATAGLAAEAPQATLDAPVSAAAPRGAPPKRSGVLASLD